MCEVSVIVAAYKVEPYLPTCLESVLSQSFSDFELIAVDDGSPDACGAIIDEYAAHDSRVKPVHKENGGLSSARNAGLDRATGRFVYFLDGDDYICPHLLETVVPEMRSGYDMVAFGHETFPKDGRKCNGFRFSQRHEYHPSTPEEVHEFLLKCFVTATIRWEAWNRIYSREVIEQYGLRFVDNSDVFAEDMCFNFFYLVHRNHVLCIPDVLHYYRIRDDSIMGVMYQSPQIRQMTNLAYEVLSHYQSFSDSSYEAQHFTPLFYMIVRGSYRMVFETQFFNRSSIVKARPYIRSESPRWAETSRRVREVVWNWKLLHDCLDSISWMRLRHQLWELIFVRCLFANGRLSIAWYSFLCRVFFFVGRLFHKNKGNDQ